MKETLKVVQRIELHDKISFETENKLHFYYSQRRNSGIKSENSPNGCCTHNYLITRAIVKVFFLALDIIFPDPNFPGAQNIWSNPTKQTTSTTNWMFMSSNIKNLYVRAFSVEYQMKWNGT